MMHKLDIKLVRMPLNPMEPKYNESFNSYKRLEESISSHAHYNALCKVCDKIFLTLNPTPSRKDCPHCKQTFSCKICNKEFKSTSGLHNHQSTHHKSEVQRFLCEVCKKAFRQKGQLKTHMYIHNGEYPLQCRFCKKGFRQRGNLKFHELSHANGGESFPCKYCDKKFNHPGNRYTHEFLHTGKRFKCPTCSQFFQQISSMKKHKCGQK